MLSLFILSCNDPVFYSISTEVLPLKPRIAGPSSNFVELNGKMYVAARNKINCYENGAWTEFPINGRTTHLAATTNKLYALTEEENLIFPFSDEMTVESSIPIPNHTIISIFACRNILFIGTLYWHEDENNNLRETNGVWYLQEGDVTPLQITGGSFSMLCGVAGDSLNNFYLCSKDNNGIFLISEDNPGIAVLINNSADKEFTNIINLNTDSIVAMSRGGRLFRVTSGGVSENEIAKFSDNRKATSALGIWTNEIYSLLLVGRQDLTNTTTTGYTHGYVEIEFDAGTGELIGNTFNEPGKTGISSINENTHEHYASSIGKRGINYFYQSPGDGILFASLNHGVWSYREREPGKKPGEYTWNAEE